MEGPEPWAVNLEILSYSVFAAGELRVIEVTMNDRELGLYKLSSGRNFCTSFVYLINF
jgi:hypothetical protein